MPRTYSFCTTCEQRIQKVKVKVTLVQALRLCTGRTAHRGSRGIALPFHDHGTRRGWGVSVTPWPLFTPGKDPVPIVREAGWAPGPVWIGAANLAPTGIRSPDRPARSHYTDYAIRPTEQSVISSILPITRSCSEYHISKKNLAKQKYERTYWAATTPPQKKDTMEHKKMYHHCHKLSTQQNFSVGKMVLRKYNITPWQCTNLPLFIANWLLAAQGWTSLNIHGIWLQICVT